MLECGVRAKAAEGPRCWGAVEKGTLKMPPGAAVFCRLFTGYRVRTKSSFRQDNSAIILVLGEFRSIYLDKFPKLPGVPSPNLT